MDDMPDHHTLVGEHLRLAYDTRRGRRRPDRRHPTGADHRHRRRQRLRQVDAAAGPGPAAQAGRRHWCCSTGESIHRLPTKEVATAPGHPAAVADRARGHHASPTSSPAAATRTRAGSASGHASDEEIVTDGDGGHRHPRPRRSAGRRAVGRSAPAGLDRHGAGPGHRPACCSTSRPPTSTWPTRSRCSTCSSTSTSARVARSCSCSTTSTRPAATPTTSWPSRPGRSSPRAHRRASSTEELVREVFDIDCRVIDDPGLGHADGRADRPPRRRRRRATAKRRCARRRKRSAGALTYAGQALRAAPMKPQNSSRLTIQVPSTRSIVPS